MLKDQILQKAGFYFARIGIKGVSMDFLAGSLRISKKTIYQHFSNKEELLAEYMKLYITQNQSQLLKKAGKAQSALEAIIAINKTVLYQSLSLCPAFHQQLKYFPRLQEMLVTHYIIFIRREYLKQFTRGSEEGVFIDHHNSRLTLDFLEDRISTTREWIPVTDTTQIRNYAITIFTYLAGICTDKGRKELKSFQPDTFFNNQI